MLAGIVQCSRIGTGFLLLLVGACAGFSPSDSPLPALAVRVDAPDQYRSWFESTAACSGLDGEFQAIEWYVVPGADQFVVDGAPRVGMWQRVGGRSQIVVAGNYTGHEMVVRHEMLHHLLGREGHPSEIFVNRCQLTWESWAGRGAVRLAITH